MKIRYPKLVSFKSKLALLIYILLGVFGAPVILFGQELSEDTSSSSNSNTETIENESSPNLEPAVTSPAPGDDEAASETDDKADAPSETSEDSDSRIQLRKRYELDSNLFGSYRIRILLGKPDLGEGLRFYDKLYGKPRGMLTLGADWFAWDWYATMGLGFRVGYYRTKGYTFKKPAGVDIKDVTEDQITLNSPATLTLIPVQVNALMQFTPFPGKWLVLDGWFGVERMYFQEVRNTKSASTASNIRFAAIADDQAKVYTNRGMKNSVVFGGAANIMLNWLDESSASSLQTIGFRYVYLSPYFEVVRPLGDDGGASFARKVIGIGFTFESLK